MIYLLGVLFFVFAFLLIAVILLQEGKGGGLAAMSGAMTDSVMGAKNPMRKITVYLFVGFVALILGLNVYINRQSSVELAPGLTPDIPAVESPAQKAEDAVKAVEKAEGEKPAATENAAATEAKPAENASGTDKKQEAAPAAK